MSDEAGRVFCEHLAFAWHVALSAARDAAEAEDVVQDAYLNFVRGFAGFDRSRPVRPYLARAVTNAAADRARSEARRAEHGAALAREKGAEMRDPETQQKEQAEALHAALRRLEPGLRLAVALRHLHGLSLEETAEVLELPRATASDRVARGLEELRRMLAAAGFGALAPAALAALPMPGVPAKLAATLSKLAGQSLAATTGTGVSCSAAKGGLAMKLVLGVLAAGAVATGLSAFGLRLSEQGELPSPPAAPAASSERKDPPPDQKYQMRLLVWNYWSGQCAGLLDGPAGQAQATDLIKGHDVDDAGNVYWTESETPVIRSYRADTNRVVTVAGSIRGLADGPLARARFGGWAYNKTNLICVSGNGKHLFVRDCFGKGQWRYVDLEAGTVTSLGLCHHYPKGGRTGGYFIIARDRMGDVYAFITDGQDPPDCKGYKKLKVAPLKKEAWYDWDRYALDVEKMRLYFHCRAPVNAYDLKTGEIACITSADNKARPINTSGPLETTCFLCPTGMALSPAGRYLYVGQGDGSSCFRLDLEKKQALAWGGLDDGGFGWRDTANRKCDMTGSTGWPAATVFIPDGRGFWANCWGLYALTPMKGGN
jgi:RNA polymerase sigma-70 factor (ECF subfamily)